MDPIGLNNIKIGVRGQHTEMKVVTHDRLGHLFGFEAAFNVRKEHKSM